MNKKLMMAVIACALLFSVACMLFGPQRGPLQFQPNVLPAAQAGVPYEAKVAISGNVTPAGQFSVPEGALPPGLALETLKGENTGRIFGTPTQAGTFKFKIFVWCFGTNISGQTGEKDYTLVVK